MINAVLCISNGKMCNLTSAQLGSRSPKQTVWVDVINPSREELEFLRDNLPLHNLALEDCLSFTHRPKIVSYPEHMFLVVHDIHTHNDELIFNELTD